MPRTHVLLALAVMVVWGINFVVVEVGLETFPPLLFAALRFALVAFPAVLLIRRPPIHWGWILAVGTFLSGLQFALLFVGMDLGMPAGLASLVLQLQAMFTIGLAVLLLGERPARRQILGAGIALGGIAVIAGGRAEGIPLVALLLCCAAALSWAAGNIATRVAQAPDAKALLVWSSLVPPIPLALLSLGLEDRGEITHALTTFDLGGTLALLYVVVLSTGFGYGVWTWLLKHHPASKVAPFTLAVPVVGIASAWLFLGEQPNGPELAGAGLVLVGLAFVVWQARRPAAVLAAPVAEPRGQRRRPVDVPAA